jgi:hypothetical protein
VAKIAETGADVDYYRQDENAAAAIAKAAAEADSEEESAWAVGWTADTICSGFRSAD